MNDSVSVFCKNNNYYDTPLPKKYHNASTFTANPYFSHHNPKVYEYTETADSRAEKIG
jgi:hypothetical protein